MVTWCLVLRRSGGYNKTDMAKAFRVNHQSVEHTMDDLTGDDEEDIKRLSGALWDGNPEFRRRKYDIWPERKGFPAGKRDPVATAIWKRAVELQGKSPRFEKMQECEQDEVKRVLAMIESGDVNAVEDIPEDFIIRILLLKMADSRTPTVQLKSAQLLAQAKGLLGPKKASLEELQKAVEEQLDESQAKAETRAAERRAQIRAAREAGEAG